MENRAFNEMLKVARAWLENRDPADISVKCGIAFDAACSRFTLSTLGKEVHISYPDYTFEEEISCWHQLVILHYLHRADGFPVLDRPVSFAQLKDGMIRGGGFDRDSAASLSRIAAGKTAGELIALLEALGGSIVKAKADVCARLSFLPSYPVTINIYLADDEFPAEGRMLPDASSDHYLPVEDAVTVGTIILEALERNL